MNLDDIRKRMDLLDSRILEVLNNRMELVLMAKRLIGKGEVIEREKELLERIRKNSTGLINGAFIEKVYMEILKESKELQKKDHKLIAFRGEHGAFGEVAATEWNKAFISVPCGEFAEVFEGVRSGLYDFGIVPVENTLGGVVGQVNELLIHTDLKVVGAVELPIHLCLLALPGTDHREIRTVYSPPQMLAYCRSFLLRNKLEPVSFYDSAGAAKMLSEKALKYSAVIASRPAASLYNLEIIKEDINDFSRNITRFLVLSGEENKEVGDKCSVVFSTEHKAGTLFRVLEIFAREDINLTRIGSIPDAQGSYVFFLDFVGSGKDEKTVKALKEVEEITSSFRLMGSYKERKAA